MTKTLDEVIILNDSTYDRVLDMLCSPDRDNVQVAVSIIEAVDFQKNAPYILLLAKDAEAKLKRDNNPFRTELFGEAVTDVGSCSFNHEIRTMIQTCTNQADKLNYNSMYEELTRINTDAVAMNFFLGRFADALKDHLLQWGFTFVKSMDLKLVPHDKTRFTGEGQ
jgi:hypothetical protein